MFNCGTVKLYSLFLNLQGALLAFNMIMSIYFILFTCFSHAKLKSLKKKKKVSKKAGISQECINL